MIDLFSKLFFRRPLAVNRKHLLMPRRWICFTMILWILTVWFLAVKVHAEPSYSKLVINYFSGNDAPTELKVPLFQASLDNWKPTQFWQTKDGYACSHGMRAHHGRAYIECRANILVKNEGGLEPVVSKTQVDIDCSYSYSKESPLSFFVGLQKEKAHLNFNVWCE